MRNSYGAAVAGWFADLRAGEASTWSDWLAEHPVIGADAPVPRTSAVQLELVRRLAAEPPGTFEGLADLVASTPAYGRGRGDVPLPWPEAPAFGPPPLTPEDLPAEELLRVAGPVLAGLAERLPAAAPGPGPSARRWWRRGVSVSGPQRQVVALRRQLRAAGVRDGGRAPTRIVLVEPFEHGMFDLWAQRITDGGSVRWRRFWQIRSRTDRVPATLDGPGLVRAAATPPRGRLHVVVTSDHAAASHALSELLGVPLELPGRDPWADLDMVRMVNRVLEARVTPQVRRDLDERLLALVGNGAGAPPGAPRPYRSWAKETAIRLAADLADLVAAGGYPVHGNIADLVGGDGKEAGAPVRTSADQTLAVAVRAIRAAWTVVGGGR